MLTSYFAGPIIQISIIRSNYTRLNIIAACTIIIIIPPFDTRESSIYRPCSVPFLAILQFPLYIALTVVFISIVIVELIIATACTTIILFFGF